jgi:DNA-binding NarL/FixJ family response regulator
MTKARVRRPVILVADGHKRLRDELVRRLQESMTGWTVLPASDGESLLLLGRRHAVEAVVMDVVLPGSGGLDVIERLKQQQPNVKIVVFSLRDGGHFQERVAKAGASAFISKGRPFSEILDALKSVLSVV